MPTDREELRRECYELLGTLRSADPPLNELAFRLIENILIRLDRLETGHFQDPNETPTRPDRIASQQLRAIKKTDSSAKDVDD